MEPSYFIQKHNWWSEWTSIYNVFLTHLYYSDNFLENADLQEVAAIYRHVTDTPRDFSDKFQEFSEFALQGNDHNDMPSIVASDLNLFCI